MLWFLRGAASTPKTESRPIHLGSHEQQEIVDYIWDTYKDKTFLYLAKAENGEITPDRKHSKRYWCSRTRSWGHDWGLYGISDCYHPEITSDPRFFSDWKWQVDQAYRFYKGGTKFYGLKRINKVKKFFIWK